MEYEMLDLIKKSIYLGLGAATASKEKIESLVDELIEKGQLTKDDKPKVVQDILDKIEKEEKEIKTKINNTVTEGMNKLGVVAKSDYDNLLKRVEELEKKNTK
jgi:polyhydroxyalkanoate synthesis regulator phasin|tara:strand:- start:651 stop:959 length:309 start_codon:yes stop_codon:yes gene_type:complete